MYGTNLETPCLVLSTGVMGMLTAVLVVETDRVEESDFVFFGPPKRAPLCCSTIHASRSHCISCTHRPLKTPQIAGSGSIVSCTLTEQETKNENLTHFSTHSSSTVPAATIVSSDGQASFRRGNMYPCCFDPMLLALHAR